jgi:hypothetical protein
MPRRVLLLLGVIVLVPAIAQAAITVTVGTHNLLQNTAGQTINIMLTSTAGSEYSSTDMRTVIAAGGPQVTHVFNDVAAGIPIGNLAGSIWAGGSGGINAAPNGTTATSTGRQTAGGFATAGFANQSTGGIFVTLTVTTVGISPGLYALNLTGHPSGSTRVWISELDEFGDPTGNLLDTFPILENGFLNVVPEPGSVVLALFAVAGFGFVAVRRHRARNAA